MVAPDNVVIEVPIVLRDRLANQRLHPRQAYYEIVEAALDLWDDLGGWDYRKPMP
jgi:hypothetical protein